MYFFFLVTYSYFAMLDKYTFEAEHDHGLPMHELFLVVTVFAYFVAEVYQVCGIFMLNNMIQ